MTKKRNRAKQTTTLDERLTRFVNDLRQQARAVKPNTDQAMQLRKRISHGEAALHFNERMTGGK